MLGLNSSLQPLCYWLYQLFKVQWGHLQQEGDDPSVLDGLLQLWDGAIHGVLAMQLVVPYWETTRQALWQQEPILQKQVQLWILRQIYTSFEHENIIYLFSIANVASASMCRWEHLTCGRYFSGYCMCLIYIGCLLYRVPFKKVPFILGAL